MGASGALSCFLARAAVPRLGMGSLMSPLTKTSGKHLVLPRAYAFGVHCGKLGSWGVHGVLQDLLDLPNQPDQSAMSVHQHPEYPEKLGVASICKTYFPPSEKKSFFFSCSCIPLPPGFPRDSGIALQLGALLGGSCHSRMVTPEEGWKLEMLGQWVEQTPGSREQQRTHSGTYSDMSQSLKSVLWSRLE